MNLNGNKINSTCFSIYILQTKLQTHTKGREKKSRCDIRAIEV